MLFPDFQQDIDASLTVLQNGGVILYPTDTIWGIGCDATDAAAVSKVFALKQRAETKSLIVLMADEKDILKYTSQPDLRIFDYLHTVTKPTTVIYEGAVGLAGNLIGADGTVAIRLVDDPFCRHLIKRLRKPLVSTSANISGEPAPSNFMAIDLRVKEGVDYIVHHRQDDITPREPSAIVRWNNDGTVSVIRP
jgi:L-threonylcarbamoyladenylate synthase